MISAEKWYEYQEGYSKYGFDMKPRAKRTTRKARTDAAISAKDRGRILKLLLIVGIVCVGIVVNAAYGASLNYSNNQLKDENAALQGEVEMLQIQIESESNIAEIQDKATKQLGMVYPEGEKLSVLTASSDEPEDLATTLKKNAFN